MIRWTTSGESHGRALTAIIEGLPSNLPVDTEEIDRYLALRQGGYGRGARQKIETDRVQILSGVRNKLTLGSPVCLMVENKDYANWEAYMSPYGADVSARRLTRVRPGHADLSGVLKYDQTDARNILERASARETAVRVAAGTVARMFLRELGIEVGGYVRSVAGITDDKEYTFEQLANIKESELFMPDAALCERAKAEIDAIKEDKDTAGGIEGGMSNGEEIVLRAAMKPIPTLMRGLNTVNFDTGEACRAATERSDVCAVCACEIIVESTVCFALAQKVQERLGGDNMAEIKARYALLP